MRRSLLPFLPVLLASALTIAAQGPSASLQTGIPVEKTLAARQTHSYTVRLEKDQFAQLTIEQRGIDVVVRVFGPEGQLILQVDTPTGTEDAEYVEIVAEVSGAHRIEVICINKSRRELRIPAIWRAPNRSFPNASPIHRNGRPPSELSSNKLSPRRQKRDDSMRP